MPKPQPSGLGALLRKEREEKERGADSSQSSPVEVEHVSNDLVGVHQKEKLTPTNNNSGRPATSKVDAHQEIKRTPTRPPKIAVDAHQNLF
jgi:hypothetical protein